MSTIKTGLLMAAITAMLVVFGKILGGTTGIVIALGFALFSNVIAYWFSDKIVLATTRAQPITPYQAPALYAMVERLSTRAEIPMPRLYVVPDMSPNAFATGRNPQHGVVAVNQGLLNILDEREVEGVIAHEIAHIKHRDTLTSTIVATLAGAISALANMAMFASMFGGSRSDDGDSNPLVALLAMLFAPIAAMMIQFAVSRTREFQADATAAKLVGSPVGLQRALHKLHAGVMQRPGNMPPSSAHMCIVNPFAGVGSGLMKLFSTHPPVEERIQRLEKALIA
ncbi:MAG: zinc metalloprotease HtpX [Armatimonadetes bacterium]|nr:zinc metalloprotease HtpX [Armatimonadota bacterium]